MWFGKSNIKIYFNLVYNVIRHPDDKNKDNKKTASSDTVLHGLKKYTNYTIQVLASTSGGDGVRSQPIHCQTEQDGKIKLKFASDAHLFFTL